MNGDQSTEDQDKKKNVVPGAPREMGLNRQCEACHAQLRDYVKLIFDSKSEIFTLEIENTETKLEDSCTVIHNLLTQQSGRLDSTSAKSSADISGVYDTFRTHEKESKFPWIPIIVIAVPIIIVVGAALILMFADIKVLNTSMSGHGARIEKVTEKLDNHRLDIEIHKKN